MQLKQAVKTTNGQAKDTNPTKVPSTAEVKQFNIRRLNTNIVKSKYVKFID